MNGNGIIENPDGMRNLPNHSTKRMTSILVLTCFVMGVQGWIPYLEDSPEVNAPAHEDSPEVDVPERKRQHPALGADVTVVFRGDTDLNGELVAVEPDQIWLFSHGDSLIALPFAGIRKILIHPFGLTAGNIAGWTGIVGLLTTVGMTIACTSVNENGCGTFALIWVGAWVTIGTISGLLIRPSRKIWPSKAELRAYARFPQGLPDGFPLSYPAHNTPQVKAPHVVPTGP